MIPKCLHQSISNAGVWLRDVYDSHWGDLSAKERILKIVKIAAVLAVVGGVIALFVLFPVPTLFAVVMIGSAIEVLSRTHDLCKSCYASYKDRRTAQFANTMAQAAAEQRRAVTGS